MSGTTPSLDSEIAALQADVANETTVDQSAVVLINGFAAQLAAAVAAATAAGATPAQLTSLDALHQALVADASALAAAVAANTVTPPDPVDHSMVTIVTPASPDDTQIVGGIVNAYGEIYTITPQLAISIDGVVDMVTHDVVMLVYHGGAVWQQNKWGNWWFRIRKSLPWTSSTTGPTNTNTAFARILEQLTLINVKLDTLIKDIAAAPTVAQLEKLDVLHRQMQINHTELQAAIIAATKR